MRFIYIILAISLTGCLGSKKISEKTSTIKENLSVKSDSTSKETVNRAINEKSSFAIPESNTGNIDYDKAVNEGITNAFRNYNIEKRSGDNYLKLYYDEKERRLKAEYELGETRNTEVATNNEVVDEKEKTETETYKKYVKMIPWWVWIAAFFIFFRQIMGVVSVVYPPARGITSIADLFHPPKKD